METVYSNQTTTRGKENNIVQKHNQTRNPLQAETSLGSFANPNSYEADQYSKGMAIDFAIHRQNSKASLSLSENDSLGSKEVVPETPGFKSKWPHGGFPVL